MTKIPLIITEFKELTAMTVASKNERAIADAVKKKLEALGFSVSEDDTAQKIGGNTGNLIAKLAGDPSKPWIMLSAHLDRVKNNGTIVAMVNEAEDKITSDGSSILAADDVAGICVILDGIRRIRDEGIPHGGIEIVLSVCEEVGVAGTKHLDFSQLSSKIAYVFDAPGRIGRIIQQAPTKCNIKVGVHGKSAHAGNEPEKGINAVKVAATALARLPEGRINEQTTANFGVIHGGSSTNIVCDFVEILGEARGTNDAALQAYLAVVKDAFNKTAEEFKTTIDVSIETLYETFHINESENIIKYALNAMKRMGIDGWCQSGGGGMDGNRFNRNGIQAIGIAPGYSKNHTPHEELIISDFIQCGELVKELIREVHQSS